jgi:predicted flap endonuclease-1-like 5' DNA nuclease
MGLLSKLKSVLGLGSGDDDRGGRRTEDVGVTVERERDEADAANEAAVKGVDEEREASAGDGTDTTPDTASDAEPDAEDDAVDDADAGGGADANADHEGDADPDHQGDTGHEGDADPDHQGDTGHEGDGDADVEAESGTGAGADDGDEPPADAEGDLQDIKGIGPAYADRLSEVGIESIGELADADYEAVAEEADLAPGRVEQWVDRAKARR